MPNSPKPGTATRSFRAPNTLWAQVQARAEQDHTDTSTITRRALEAYTAERINNAQELRSAALSVLSTYQAFLDDDDLDTLRDSLTELESACRT
jgi:hypothetical protein